MISYNFKNTANSIRDFKFDEMMTFVDSMRKCLGDIKQDFGDRTVGQNIFDWATDVTEKYAEENRPKPKEKTAE